METAKGSERKLLVCFNEFMGQIFFMYIVLVGAVTGSNTYGISPALALFVVINIFGGISGGHFNPVVTLAVYTREQKYAENLVFCIAIIFS